MDSELTQLRRSWEADRNNNTNRKTYLTALKRAGELRHYAIISGVEGNLEALEAVLHDIEIRDIHEIYSLGNSIGTGPDPAACIDLLREKGVCGLFGFHESMLFRTGAMTTAYALTVGVNFAREQLFGDSFRPGGLVTSSENILDRLREGVFANSITDRWNYFDSFKKVQTINGTKLQQGAGNLVYLSELIRLPAKNERYNRELLRQVNKNTEGPESLCFVYDRSRQAYYVNSLLERRFPAENISLFVDNPKIKHLVNVGAVHGSPKAQYVEFLEGEVFFHSIDYDVLKTCRKIREAPRLVSEVADRFERSYAESRSG